MSASDVSSRLARDLINDATERGDLDWRTVRWAISLILYVAEKDQRP